MQHDLRQEHTSAADHDRTTPLRYLLILDFEATCDDSGRIPVAESEIIEFPTLLYDIHTNAVAAVFHEYVRPTLHPQLTPFCTDLTGIKQDTLDGASSFPHVWTRFRGFLQEHGCLEAPGSAMFVTCGDWDLKTMLPRQLHLAKIKTGCDAHGRVLPPLNQWINIKRAFEGHYKPKKRVGGMLQMLQFQGLQLVGRHHSGIDDAMNIARIVKKMCMDGWSPGQDTSL